MEPPVTSPMMARTLDVPMSKLTMMSLPLKALAPPAVIQANKNRKELYTYSTRSLDSLFFTVLFLLTHKNILKSLSVAVMKTFVKYAENP
jgi:hypothetical protein